MGDSENQEALVGGAMLAGAIGLHLLLNKYTISVSRCIHTFSSDMPQQRFSILLGILGAAAYIAQNKASLLDTSVNQGLTIPGFIISGLLTGCGAYFAGGGFETQAFSYVPSFHQPAIIAFLLMFAGAFGSVTLNKNKPDFMNWFFGSADLGIDIDQKQFQQIFMIGSLVVFLLYVLHQKLVAKNLSFEDLIAMIVSYLCGGLYTAGILYAGLCKRSQVQAFFDFNDWQPKAGLAIGIAMVINILVIYLLNNHFSTSIECSSDADRRLYIGSILFGLGWGFTGLCLGPILVNVGAALPNIILILFPSTLLGYNIERIFNNFN